MSFESVNQNGLLWQPTHTGTSKDNNIVALEANAKSFIEGYYLGALHNQGPKNVSTIHKIKATKVGDKAHIVGEKVDDSGEVSVWGTTVLNDRLLKINIGEMTRIVWEGKKAPKSGTNHFHSWDVLVDRSVEPYKVTTNAIHEVDHQTPEQKIPKDSPVAGEVAEEDDLPF